MIATRKLLLRLSKKFPKRITRKNGDFGGLMCGALPNEIGIVYLALDMEASLLEEVLQVKPDIVITHHPFIYGRRREVLAHDEQKKETVHRLEEEGIPVYSFHTNFDEGADGMNDALAALLNLRDIKPLEYLPLGRGGFLPCMMDIREFARYAKERLGVSYGLLMPYGKTEIESVAIVGGGGSKYIDEAMKEGYDLFISGDAPHHVRRHILNHRYSYLDLPHEIEKIFVPQMKKILLQIDGELKIICAGEQKEPEVI